MAIHKHKLFVFLLESWVIFFIALWIISVFAGGDAVAGKIEDGRYYFGSHGEYKEVSRTAYILSAVSFMALFATISLFLLSVFFLLLKGSLSLKFFKDNRWDVLFILIPLLIGCGFLYGTFQALMCILRALGVVG